MAEKDSPSSSTHSHSPSHSQNLSNSISDSSSNFSNNVSVHHLPLDPHALALDLVMGTAAAVAKSFSAPIERIKLLIQNQSELLKVGRLDHPYKGIVDCFTRVVEQDGIISLWRGNWASVVRYFTSQALNFGLRDEFKHLFNAHQQQGYWRWFAINLASGGLAGACTLVFVQSLDFARTRLANDQRSLVKGGVRQFSGLTDVYRQTIRSDGFAALYRGFGVSCAGLFVYRGLFFGLYDTLKPAVVCGPWHDSLVAAFMLGWAVTLVAGFVAYPLDTIRRRRMMNGEYRSSWHCLLQIVTKEGPRAMFRGWGANVLRSVAGATSLAGYDHLEKIIFGKSISPVHAAKADHAH